MYIVSSSEQLRNSEHLFQRLLFLYPNSERKMIMWCQSRDNGKVKYNERFENPLTGKTEYVSVTMDKDTKANRKQAQLALQDKIIKKIEKLSATIKKENLTLLELVTIYLESIQLEVKESTYARNKTAANSMLRILGKDILVDKLTAAYVKKCLAEQKEKPGRTNERIKRFKAMIRWGYDNEYIDDIRWLDKLKPTRDEEKKKKLENKYLESYELALLLENMRVKQWKLLTELMALSGMRCGEAIALTETDVDFKSRVIRVDKTFDHRHKIVTSPKTEDSNREIYMQDELFVLCKKIKLHTAKEKLLTGCQSKLFMCDVNGNYLGYAAFNKHLRTISKEMLGYEITTHYLRHTHVALLAEQGISLDVIARRLGHSDSAITKHIYFHVTEKLKERDNAQLKNVKLL